MTPIPTRCPTCGTVHALGPEAEGELARLRAALAEAEERATRTIAAQQEEIALLRAHLKNSLHVNADLRRQLADALMPAHLSLAALRGRVKDIAAELVAAVESEG